LRAAGSVCVVPSSRTPEVAATEIEVSSLESGQWWGVFYDLQGAAAASTATYDFTPAVLPAGVTLTRASAGTYVTTAGALASAAVDAPRFDYDATTHALRGLLIEAAATNLFLQSQDLTSASWAKANVTATATTLIETATNVTHQATQSIAFTSGQPMSASAIASERPGSAKRYLAIFFNMTVNGANSGAVFNLATGTFALVGTGASASMTPTAGGWMCRATVTPTATLSAAVFFRLSATATAMAAYLGDGTSGINLSEMQCEAGSVATSRIRTTTAAATRAADVVTLDWGRKNVPDGPITATVTFDDGSTQAVPATVTAGKIVIPTPLNRSRVKSASTTFADQPYVVVPDAQIGTYMAQSRYVYVDRQATLTGGAEPTDDTPPIGHGGGGGGGGVIP
jgi:hypothetical protein